MFMWLLLNVVIISLRSLKLLVFLMEIPLRTDIYIYSAVQKFLWLIFF